VFLFPLLGIEAPSSRDVFYVCASSARTDRDTKEQVVIPAESL
jgi:hypothetical protein